MEQGEVLGLDTRIEELQTRITNKRVLNQQIQNQLTIQQSSIQQQLNSPQQKVNSYDNQSSPSKIIPKFATKQEIANTYMNKFGSEAYQKYQEASKRLLQQQQQIIQMNNQPSSPQQQQQDQPPFVSNHHTKQISIDSNDSSSNTSTGNSISPSNQDQQQPPQQDQNSLPSHLKLEFDKIKFIPDMVKTIKKTSFN